MRKLRDALKGVRKLEWLLVITAIAALIVLSGGNFLPGAHQTALEKRIQASLAQIDGVGRVYVTITENARGEPSGALIIAEGAANVRTQLKIQYAVQTLLSLDAQKIEIMQYGGGKS